MVDLRQMQWNSNTAEEGGWKRKEIHLIFTPYLPLSTLANKHQKLSMSKNEEGSSDESDIDSEDVVCIPRCLFLPFPPATYTHTLTGFSSSFLRKRTFHFWWAWTLMRWRLDLHLNTSVKRQLKQPYNWEVLRAQEVVTFHDIMNYRSNFVYLATYKSCR